MGARLLAPAGDPAAGAAAARRVLDELDRLVAEDVAAAATEAEAAIRGRHGATLARIRGQVEQLERALARTAPGAEGLDAALAFYATAVPPLADAQVRREAVRRDDALAEMEALRARLSRLALGIGLAAPALLAGLYLGLLRPLFGRLSSATAAAGALAAGAPAAGAGGHDELGLLLARLRLTGTRLARDRARLEATVAERTAALTAANAGLSRADSARRRFFADVGHELRTPLTVILGEAELGMGQADATAPDQLRDDPWPRPAAVPTDRGSAEDRPVGERAARAWRAIRSSSAGRCGPRWPTPRRCWRGPG